MKAMIAIVSALLALPSAASRLSSAEDEWRFTVLLDGKPIGYHRYAVRNDGVEREVVSEARFNVKVLFINVYRYVHDDRETWQDECVARIDSRTDDNGAKTVVSGSRVGDRFALSIANQTRELSDCVMTFAYWNPRILEATRLLNPQTGEYVSVRISCLGNESLTTNDGASPAEHFRLIGDSNGGEKLQIDLWYSPNKDWLGLESLTADGHRLRYRRELNNDEGARHASAH